MAKKAECSNCKSEGYRARGCAVCGRIEAEKRWVRKFVRNIIQKGGHVAVDYGEGDKLIYMSAEATIMSLVYACDEEWLRIRLPGDAGGSFVYLVYGNADDGSEVFSDWGMKVDPIMTEIGYSEA